MNPLLHIKSLQLKPSMALFDFINGQAILAVFCSAWLSNMHENPYWQEVLVSLRRIIRATDLAVQTGIKGLWSNDSAGDAAPMPDIAPVTPPQ